MDNVGSLEEATDWFLKHSQGSVICWNGGKPKVCDNYPQAEIFYTEED